jgi:uncharacterized protein YdeI (YjbR/CyaY-like superfamily)
VADDALLLTVADAQGWSAWLADHGNDTTGVWLVLAKKGTSEPTSLTYDDALAAIDRAKADGSWGRAYEGQAAIEVPSDFAAALADSADAQAMFDRLSATNRYAVLYRVTTAKRAETRHRRIEQLVTMLAQGETIHPQRERRKNEG